QDPLGKRLSLEGPSGPWLTVVGLAGWTRQMAPGKPVDPEIYLPFHTGGRIHFAYLTLKVDGQPQAVVPALRKAFRELDPNLALAFVFSGEELLGSNEVGPRIIIKITAGFGVLALLLSGIGIYGVMSLLVEFRTREIGVRMALGARVWDVLRLVLTDGLGMVALGLSLGLLGGYGLGHAISSLLYGVTPADPATFLIAAGSLAFVALLSIFIPARRAATVNPVVALRDE
ncbi:MAG: FtsX-like permease family protein, partial [Holophaga sp.]|nr:FtsX-like permease family protein [Holophaga sp.]